MQWCLGLNDSSSSHLQDFFCVCLSWPKPSETIKTSYPKHPPASVEMQAFGQLWMYDGSLVNPDLRVRLTHPKSNQGLTNTANNPSSIFIGQAGFQEESCLFIRELALCSINYHQPAHALCGICVDHRNRREAPQIHQVNVQFHCDLAGSM